MNDNRNEAASVPPSATGGDEFSDRDRAATVGDEAIGGTAPTPDQDVVDEIGAAAGVPIPDEQPIQVRDRLEARDEERWELDPDSAE